MQNTVRLANRSRRTLAAFALLCATAGAIAVPFVAQPQIARAAQTAPNAELPAAEKILDKYIEVTGGKDAYQKVKTRTVTGKLAMPAQGINGKITAYNQAPNLMFSVVEIDGIGRVERGYNGDAGIAWEKSAMQGTRLLDGDELDHVRQESMLAGEVNWRDLYKDAKTIGVEKVEGNDCYKVMLTNKATGKTETRFYNQSTGLLEQSKTELDTPNGKFDITSIPSDYRVVEGLKVPFKSTQRMKVGEVPVNQEIVMTEIKVNTDIPADTFKVPDDVKALAEKQKSGGGGAAPKKTDPDGKAK